MKQFEQLELLTWLEEKITKLTQADTFQFMKLNSRKKCYTLINTIIEVKGELAMNHQLVHMAEYDEIINGINRMYCELYGKNDLVKKSHYNKEITHQPWKNVR